MSRHYLCYCFLLFSSFSFSDTREELTENFKDSYQRYQEIISLGETRGLKASSRSAYRYGKELYGTQTQTTAILALNYSVALDSFDESEMLATESLSILEKLHGDDSIELIDPLMQLGTLYSKNLSPSKARGFFNRALGIVQQSDPDNTLLLADLNFEAGSILSIRNARFGNSFLIDGKELYEEQDNLAGRYQAHNVSFWLGKNHLSARRFQRALAFFNESLEFFSFIDSGSEMTLILHGFLTQTYVLMGEDDKATAHIEAIGFARELTAQDKDAKPIYLSSPEYPENAARQRQEGSVTLSFTITVEGYVKNPEVIDSVGTRQFHVEAIKALLDSRFAPRVSQGSLIETDNNKYRYSFTIAE